MQDLKILVCHYKESFLIPENNCYINIQCGKDDTGLDLNILGDNTGENISARNKYWSEITGLYWAWKNLEPVNYIGLCSYRRFFNFNTLVDNPVNIISSRRKDEINGIQLPDISSLFRDFDIVIPKPYTYAYSIRRVCSMNYNDSDFYELERVILLLHPDYFDSYKKVLFNTNKAIGHNMFIMQWSSFNNYCEWVFSILFELEKRINPIEYSVSQVRVFGYMHELLLAVYIEKHQMRQFYSQITWICDNATGFKFNNISYRFLANAYYAFNKIFRKNYPQTHNAYEFLKT